MATDRHIYGEVENKTDLKKIFVDIRHNIDKANSRPALTELYKRAGYLIALSQAPSWEKKFGDDASVLRELAEDEFTTTARQINHRAKQIGTESDYDEHWGDGK
jgi:hypothetical protein